MSSSRYSGCNLFNSLESLEIFHVRFYRSHCGEFIIVQNVGYAAVVFSSVKDVGLPVVI
jgi:hypothetical protein